MSGGYVETQGDYDHQVIVINIKGKIDVDKQNAWNESMFEMKKILGAQLIAVTLGGRPTPRKFQGRDDGTGKPAKKKKKASGTRSR